MIYNNGLRILISSWKCTFFTWNLEGLMIITSSMSAPLGFWQGQWFMKSSLASYMASAWFRALKKLFSLFTSPPSFLPSPLWSEQTCARAGGWGWCRGARGPMAMQVWAMQVCPTVWSGHGQRHLHASKKAPRDFTSHRWDLNPSLTPLNQAASHTTHALWKFTRNVHFNSASILRYF